MKKDINRQKKVVFFGVSEFAVAALEALHEEGHKIVAVITQSDKPAGRKKVLTPPPIKVVAQKLGLPILQPEKLKNNLELVEQLKNLLNHKRSMLNASLGIVAAYGKLIPPEIFNLPKHGMLNIHPSLLPKYRGPSPIQTALLNGDTETGVTIIKVDEEMDRGEIVSSIKYQVSSSDNYEFLQNKLAQRGADLLIKTLPDYLAGKIKPVPQNHSQATYTKKFTTVDGEIKPDETVEQAYNKIRALNPEPGTYIWFNQNTKKTRLKILEAKLPSELGSLASKSPEVEPLGLFRGSTSKNSKNSGDWLFLKDDNPALQLKNGYMILKTVQPEGKRPMSSQEFASGYRAFTSNKNPA